jgi:hypothetical protein
MCIGKEVKDNRLEIWKEKEKTKMKKMNDEDKRSLVITRRTSFEMRL